MKRKILYVTKDRERATGMAVNEGYEILSSDGSEDTLSLLKKKETLKKIKDGSYSVLVFKNNSQIEDFAKENNFKLLNPEAKIAEMVENKITQVKWLAELGDLLPPHKIVLVKDIVWNKEIFILQWAHSHTGDGTLLIKNEKELEDIKKIFPEREARVTTYIRGPMFTLNVIVSKDKILTGNVSYQITGILPFTENPMSTVGNDWSVPPSILSDNQLDQIKKIAIKIGEKMKSSGWKGLFGIDVIYDEERDKIYLIEINARQPASTTFESELEVSNRNEGMKGLTVFEAHIASLLDESISENIIEINDGAQIVKRVTKADLTIDKNGLRDNGFNIIEYNNKKINADSLRIQCSMGIMEAHNKFNKRGKTILESIV